MTEIARHVDDTTDASGHYDACFDSGSLRQLEDLHRNKFNVLFVDSHVKPLPYFAVNLESPTWLDGMDTLPWNTTMVQNPNPIQW